MSCFNNTPRKPTPEEKAELAALNAQQNSTENSSEQSEIWTSIVDYAYIAVFDDYVTGCPGWAGKLMVVIFDGSPCEYQVYLWGLEGKLEQVEQAQDL